MAVNEASPGGEPVAEELPAGPHPAVDVVTDRVAVILQERDLVPLTAWIADTARICAEAGRGLQVVTPDTARLTMPLRLLLNGPDVRWVARAGAGYYDGITGRTLRWHEGAFVPDERADVPRLAPSYAGAPPEGWQLVVQAWVGHAATESTMLGEATALLCTGLTGAPPRGFGAAEPVTQPWHTDTLTAMCRERAPRPTRLAVVADGAIGALNVHRYVEGLDERLTLVAAIPEPPPDLDTLRALAEDLVARVPVRTLVLQIRQGRPDLTCPARFEGPPIPVAAAVGTDVVGRRGVEHALTAPARSAARLGRRRPAVWYELWDTGEDGSVGWQRLTEVLGHLGIAAPGISGEREGGGAPSQGWQGHLDPATRTWGDLEQRRT